MSEKAPNQNVAMIRNIIVGVSTSVIGAASLYFLGINKSGGSTSAQGSPTEMKEATTKAWKSYIADDNIYYKNAETIGKELQQDMNFASYKSGILREMHKFQDDVEGIMKEDNLDKTFITMLKRRMEMEKEIEEKVALHMDTFKEIMEGNDPQKQQKLQQAYAKFTSDAKSLTERGATEAEGLAKALNDKYGQFFDLNESLAYKDYKSGKNNYSTNASTGNNGVASRSNIPAAPTNSTGAPAQTASNTNTNTLKAGFLGGNWNTGRGILHLDDNGFAWRWNDGNPASTGGWQAQNNQIAFYVTGGYGANSTQVFNMYNVTESSFTIQLSTNASVVYNCVKQ